MLWPQIESICAHLQQQQSKMWIVQLIAYVANKHCGIQ